MTKCIDWKLIERRWQLGAGVRELARQHGVTPAAITQRAKRHSWARADVNAGVNGTVNGGAPSVNTQPISAEGLSTADDPRHGARFSHDAEGARFLPAPGGEELAAADNGIASGAPRQVLRPSEYKVLRALTDPTLFNASDQGRAEAAGISLRQFARIKRRPHVVEWIRWAVGRMLADELPTIMRAALMTAGTPGRDGHHDRKMLLGMAGLHANERTVHVQGEVRHNLATSDRLTKALAMKEAALQRAGITPDRPVVDADYTESEA